MQRPAMVAADLKASVEQSLRRLAIDTIDVLHLHEPSPARMAEPLALLDAADRLRNRGLIRVLGLAGRWDGIAGLDVAVRVAAGVIQTGEAEWPEDQPPDVSYGALAAGPQSGFQAAVSPEQAKARLRHALARRPGGVVLISTTRLANLRSLAQVAAST